METTEPAPELDAGMHWLIEHVLDEVSCDEASSSTETLNDAVDFFDRVSMDFSSQQASQEEEVEVTSSVIDLTTEDDDEDCVIVGEKKRDMTERDNHQVSTTTEEISSPHFKEDAAENIPKILPKKRRLCVIRLRPYAS